MKYLFLEVRSFTTKIILGIFLILLPYQAFAGDHLFAGDKDFKWFVEYMIGSLVAPLFGLIIGAAVVFFMWNMFGAIKSADQSEERAKMKERALWGIIGIFVMVSMWGIVGFLTSSLKLNDSPLRLEQFE